MIYSQQGILIYPTNGLTSQIKTTIAQAYVDELALETLENELLMWDKAATRSADYGATETHRSIYTALTPALATAITDAMADVVDGLWYLLDADEQLIATNDTNKLDQGEVTGSLDWQFEPPPNYINYVANEVRRDPHDDGLYICVQSHQCVNAEWYPSATGVINVLWRKFMVPGEVIAWEQPIGSWGYTQGARVERNGIVYISQIDVNVWEPGAAGIGINIWRPEDYQEPEYRTWAQYDGTPATIYALDEIVIHEAQLWESQIPNNAGYEPGVVGSNIWLLVGTI